ncbi:glycoside hydrolase family 38 C-terminal domain-containing protein [Synechococcus sp. M16CYN]|uniref:alpha-mannosidase n=1 Tax=Synechococcus sp. M16CYN TaxID=3103139 RepID=UPI0030DF000E
MQGERSEWIETFRSRTRRDLQSQWRRSGAAGSRPFLEEPWGGKYRLDWTSRGLLVWPRGRQWVRLEQRLIWPDSWRQMQASHARLAMSWWAEQMRFWVDGVLIHEGDLFDTTCRWRVPKHCQLGAILRLQLELCSPLHDDGALISTQLDLEPDDPVADSDFSLVPEALMLHLTAGGSLPANWYELEPDGPDALYAVVKQLRAAAPTQGEIFWIAHAHLDLAWLWPVADTWQAAEQTFRSVLDLMKHWPELRFSQSTPALYAWMERHRPVLFSEIQAASQARRWEPVNGPWVETDCVLISTASLWQQFSIGQQYSQKTFPNWKHNLAWLPDSFGFGAGLPAVASSTGVRWFCTHKLAWNAVNTFPHRLFRWRSRGGLVVNSLMLPPIGRRGDPMDMLQEQCSWRMQTGHDSALWIPGVGNHGGGPTEEMLEQIQLWDSQPSAVSMHDGTVRDFLTELDPVVERLPIWCDELYLERHRGCATSRPDQKRHNRILERLLREADSASALLALKGQLIANSDWRTLLFHQFHDILPGTSIPEVFDQADPIWRDARRQARQRRDRGLATLLNAHCDSTMDHHWVWCALQPLAHWSPILRLPVGGWNVAGEQLPQQASSVGGTWVQLPPQQGISSVSLERQPLEPKETPRPRGPVIVQEPSLGVWRIGNGLIELDCSAEGLLQIRDRDGREQLATPLHLERYRDRGEFWDAWDLAADYREHPLGVEAIGPLQWIERGPLVAHVVLKRQFGSSRLRLDLRLQADQPWLELILNIDWYQCHEVLRLELPLAQPAVRVAADTSGGVIERPAMPKTKREATRWELPVISWMASQAAAPGGGLAVLLDGPQGVDWEPDRLGVSLLRGPTWPDPGADRGQHKHRLALMPIAGSWNAAGVGQAAIAFREPGWCRPLQGIAKTWFPPLPPSLNPVSLQSDSDMVVCLRLFNAGPSRCQWRPGHNWTIHRYGEDMSSKQVMIGPGKLVELRLRQSS